MHVQDLQKLADLLDSQKSSLRGAPRYNAYIFVIFIDYLFIWFWLLQSFCIHKIDTIPEYWIKADIIRKKVYVRITQEAKCSVHVLSEAA